MVFVVHSKAWWLGGGQFLKDHGYYGGCTCSLVLSNQAIGWRVDGQQERESEEEVQKLRVGRWCSVEGEKQQSTGCLLATSGKAEGVH